MRRMGVLFLCLWALAACAGPKVQGQQQKEAESHYHLGLAHLNEGLIQLASVEFQKSVDADPTYRDAHYFLGHVLFLQEENGAAANQFQKVLALNPNDSDAHNYLGRIHAVRGQLDEALLAYRAALKNPQYETPQNSHYNIGLIYMIQEKYGPAAESFRATLRIDPGYSRAHNMLGKASFKMGQIEEAIASYEAGLQLAPDLPHLHYNLGEAYLQQGKKDLAVAAFAKTIEVAPKSPEAADAQRQLDSIGKAGPGKTLQGRPK